MGVDSGGGVGLDAGEPVVVVGIESVGRDGGAEGESTLRDDTPSDSGVEDGGSVVVGERSSGEAKLDKTSDNCMSNFSTLSVGLARGEAVGSGDRKAVTIS